MAAGTLQSQHALVSDRLNAKRAEGWLLFRQSLESELPTIAYQTDAQLDALDKRHLIVLSGSELGCTEFERMTPVDLHARASERLAYQLDCWSEICVKEGRDPLSNPNKKDILRSLIR